MTREVERASQEEPLPPSSFIEQNFPLLTPKTKEKIIDGLEFYEGFRWPDGAWDQEFRSDLFVIHDNLQQTAQAENQRGSLKPSYNNWRVSEGLLQYVRIFNKRRNATIYSEGNKVTFNADQFNPVFLTAYKTLGFKQGRKFMDDFSRSFYYHHMDEDDWQLVGEVRSETVDDAAGIFARGIFHLNYLEDIYPEPVDLSSFQNGFVKVYREGDYRLARIYNRAAQQSVKYGGNFDNLTDSSIQVIKATDNETAYWCILSAGYLEDPSLDCTIWDVISDLESFQSDPEKRKLTPLYTFGLYTTLERKDRQRITKRHNRIEMNNIRQQTKDGLDVENLKEWEKKYIESKERSMELTEKYPHIHDPLVFRRELDHVLTNLGNKAAYLYVAIRGREFETYDFPFVGNLVDILENFKTQASQEVYSRTCWYLPKMKAKTWQYRNMLDGIIKCTKRHGDEETIKRIKYTWGMYNYIYVRGLERPRKKQ